MPRAGMFTARLIRVAVSVLNTVSFQCRTNSTTRTVEGYRFGDDLGSPPPRKTEVFQVLGVRQSRSSRLRSHQASARPVRGHGHHTGGPGIMGDPVTGSLLLKAGGAIFSGVSAMQSAKAEKQQAEINSTSGARGRSRRT